MMALNLYRIEAEDYEWDTFKGFIVAAENPEVAKQLAMHQVTLNFISESSDLYKSPDEFFVSFINRAETELVLQDWIDGPSHKREWEKELARWNDVNVELIGLATDAIESRRILLAEYSSS